MDPPLFDATFGALPPIGGDFDDSFFGAGTGGGNPYQLRRACERECGVAGAPGKRFFWRGHFVRCSLASRCPAHSPAHRPLAASLESFYGADMGLAPHEAAALGAFAAQPPKRDVAMVKQDAVSGGGPLLQQLAEFRSTREPAIEDLFFKQKQAVTKRDASALPMLRDGMLASAALLQEVLQRCEHTRRTVLLNATELHQGTRGLQRVQGTDSLSAHAQCNSTWTTLWC